MADLSSKTAAIDQLESETRQLTIAHFHPPDGWDSELVEHQFNIIMDELRELRGY